MSPSQRVECGRSGGTILTTLLIVMVPLMMIVTAATTVMTGRNDKLLRSVQEQKALLAASAAIEQAVQSAQAGTLRSGEQVDIDLGNGVHCSYLATYLGNDGDDNDGDGLADEADERAFEVVAEGTHGVARRRVAANIIEPAPLPAFLAAILALGQPQVETTGNSRVSGLDTRINGLRGPAVNDVNGIDTEPPHTAAELRADYTQKGTSSVVGKSGTPSLGVLPAPYNLPGLISTTRIGRFTELAPGTTSASMGDARINNWQVTYVPGDLHWSGSKTGAGILFVTGNLNITGSVHWDGVIIALGNITMGGSALVNGAVVQGHTGASIKLAGGAVVRYSTEAVDRVRTMLPQMFTVDGWREIGK